MRSKHGTLSAATVATETFAVVNLGWVYVTIRDGATGPIYFTVDGTTPTVGGDDTWVVQAVGGHIKGVQIPTSISGTSLEVKLISASADGYSVEVV